MVNLDFFFTFSFWNELLFCKPVPIFIFRLFVGLFPFIWTLILVIYKIYFRTLIDNFKSFLSLKFFLKNFKCLIFLGKVILFFFRIFWLFLVVYPLAIRIYELLLMINDQQNVVKQIWESFTKRQLFFIKIFKLNVLLVNSFHSIFKLINQLFEIILSVYVFCNNLLLSCLLSFSFIKFSFELFDLCIFFS